MKTGAFRLRISCGFLYRYWRFGKSCFHYLQGPRSPNHFTAVA